MILTLVMLVMTLTAAAARGQIPAGLPGGAPAGGSGAPTEQGKVVAAPTKDNPEATVAESPGKIDVQEDVDTHRIQDFLDETLSQYPGVFEVHAQVKGSVVTLTGHVEDDVVRDHLREVALKVKGVVFVINKIKTDAQVLSASELLLKRLRDYSAVIERNWLLFVLALTMIVVSLVLARLFMRYGELLLRPFSSNALLNSVLASLVSAAIVLGGLFSALQVFGIAHAVLSVLGLAGLVAVAIGFAFRDITENFISSILLGLRRPFRVGDYITVAGQSGVVKALNTRATILVTLEGKHVRIPNAMVFKEVLVNATASASGQGTFDVLVPYEVSTARALEAINRALRDHDSLLPDPAPRTLVEELTPAGVQLRAYFWFPSRGVDGFKILSDARLKAKVALQEAGITPPPRGVSVAVAGPIPIDLPGGVPGGGRWDRAMEQAPTAVGIGPAITAEQAADNLRRDAQAAASADETPTHPDALEQILDVAGTAASEEGENLLAGQGPAEVENVQGDGDKTSNR
jgi:small conductance mechanosensitive channel